MTQNKLKILFILFEMIEIIVANLIIIYEDKFENYFESC